jgi:L-ascorbate metabolism protein UlaG (beta-lactamase superfamily)
MRLRFLGHSTFLLSTGEHHVLIDPFIQGNPKAAAALDELLALGVSHVLVSHAHGDHWGNTMDFAKAGATIVSSNAIVGYAEKQGAAAGEPLNIGGGVDLPWGRVTLTQAWHDSVFPDGTFGGTPAGLLIEAEGKKIYHAGDTSLFTDMRLTGELGIDLALLPAGDRYTMGMTDAAKALDFLKPKQAVPIHWGTFPGLAKDPSAFLDGAKQRRVDARVVQPGETIEL